jgi:hypothetical protein
VVPQQAEGRRCGQEVRARERIDGGWDPAEFFASWVPGKNPDKPEDEGWLVVFGCREGIPEQWETYWKSFNTRRAGRSGMKA